MTYEWAKPGVKVVCIAERPWKHQDTGESLPGPVKGSVLTIRRTGTASELFLLCFHEFDGAVGYNADLFKPLVEKKLPDCLTALLKNPKRTIIPDRMDFGKSWESVFK